MKRQPQQRRGFQQSVRGRGDSAAVALAAVLFHLQAVPYEASTALERPDELLRLVLASLARAAAESTASQHSIFSCGSEARKEGRQAAWPA